MEYMYFVISIKKIMKLLLLTHLIFLLSFTQAKSQRDSFPSNLLVNSTIRIEGYRDTVINGLKKWITSTGTGFFFQFKIDTTIFECIVTNKHVISQSSYGRLKFKVLKETEHIFSSVSKVLDIPKFNEKWIFHPDEDLAILPLKPIADRFQKEFHSEIRHVRFAQEFIPTLKDSLEISCIEKVLMIGYPKGLWDSANNLPIIRQGITATPFFSDFNNRKRFLIDIPTFGGSSGSPVLLYSFDPYWKTSQWLQNDFRAYLLGIVVESYNYDAEGSIVVSGNRPPTVDSLEINKKYKTSTEVPFNIAIVIKSERLNDFIPLIKLYLSKK